MWKYIDTPKCNEFLLSLNLLDCTNNDKYIKTLYSISNNIGNNYRIYSIKKKNGKPRTIHEPSYLLKHIQKKILKNILNNKSISKYAKAYHKGISLKDNATPHLNKEVILKLDIKDFFLNITFFEVYKSCFSIEYFPKQVGMLLTHLCTYNGHLTQGSPTSAYISNLVMKSFDEEIGKFCEEFEISYTRYSDDMTFSGNFNPSKIIKKVKLELHKLGLDLNQNKIQVIHNSNCQMVTGIVANEKLQVNIKYRKKIRQDIYYIKKFGLESHLIKNNINVDRKKYLNQLDGKIQYILQINENDREFQQYKILLKSLI